MEKTQSPERLHVKMEKGIHLHTNKPPAYFRKYEKVEKVQFPSGQKKKKNLLQQTYF